MVIENIANGRDPRSIEVSITIREEWYAQYKIPINIHCRTHQTHSFYWYSTRYKKRLQMVSQKQIVAVILQVRKAECSEDQVTKIRTFAIRWKFWVYKATHRGTIWESWDIWRLDCIAYLCGFWLSTEWIVINPKNNVDKIN